MSFMSCATPGRRMARLGVPTCAVALMLSMANPAAGTAQETGGQWVLVKEWSGGTGQSKTETFAPPPGPWRVTFKSTAGERFGVFEATLRTPGNDQLVAGVFGVQADEKGILAGSFLVDSEHKEYVIEIASQGLQWRLAIEQKR